jgi:hypothetical protein
MASREVFDWNGGMVGKVIQAIGAYSIIAGTADREALKTTRAILAEPKGKLVLFPEGEPTGGENDNLLPFQSGVTQLGFWGFEDALKTDPNAEIYVLPAYIKYRMSDTFTEVQKEVDRSLGNLERHFHLSKSGKNVIERLYQIGASLMEIKEQEYGVPVENDKDFDYRIGRLRHYLLDLVAQTANLKKYNKDDNAIDKLRYILSVFELVQINAPDPKNELPSKEVTKWGRALCQKVYDFIAIKGDYLTSLPSAERIYEWIYRFENEVFGSYRPRPSKAYVSFCEPIKLSTYYKEYKTSKSKKQVVDDLTKKLRDMVQKLVDEDKARSRVLFKDDYLF